jgi:hypothetical protein
VSLFVGLLFFSAFLLPAAHAQTAAASGQCECPCACDSDSEPAAGGGLSVTWYSGTSAWWMAVVIPGSTSVSVDCGNGQGFVRMNAGWTPNMWTFSSSNGRACKSTVQFIVNGGSAQAVTAPF